MDRNFSPDLKDLIQKMLQVNPVKRIKLSEIKKHKWFLQDLPPYLVELANRPLKNENIVDREIV